MWDPEASYKAITLVYRLVWIIISACECYTVDYNDWYSYRRKCASAPSRLLRLNSFCDLSNENSIIYLSSRIFDSCYECLIRG